MSLCVGWMRGMLTCNSSLLLKEHDYITYLVDIYRTCVYSNEDIEVHTYTILYKCTRVKKPSRSNSL